MTGDPGSGKIQVSSHKYAPSVNDPAKGETSIISALIDDSVTARIYAGEEIIHEIINGIAARYVEENYGKIAEHLNPVAIANLTIAECSKQVAGMIRPEPKKDERR